MLTPDYILLGIALLFISIFVTLLCYPLVLRMARVWGIVDNPDERKLQRRPVPVLGGLSVFAGIAVSFIVLLSLHFYWKTVVAISAMAVLLAVGIFDDRAGLPVKVRFLVEIVVVAAIILLTGNMIDNLHGLFGLWEIPAWTGFVISIVAGVGIINSINLIDGVDGYSSSYIMMACAMFCILFYHSGIPLLGIYCLICIGSIVPFYFHNVFGQNTKMFIGDGGTLMLGSMMVIFVFSILKTGSNCMVFEEEHGVSLVASCLSVLVVPIFDTLRVMLTRMLNHRSPFKPDKTHLHHLFIELGFSHIGTACVCVSFGVLTVLAQYVAWLCGVSVNGQVILVCILGMLLTFVFYPVVESNMRNQTKLYRQLSHLAEASHIERGKFWRWMQRLVDDELFEEGRHSSQ